MKNNYWSPETIHSCQEITNVPCSVSINSLEKASRDFGGYEQGQPMAVLYPQTQNDVAALVNFAKDQQLGLTVRGSGLSQGGQTLAPFGGATVDCSQMERIEHLDVETHTLTCQPGTTWRQVGEATLNHGLLPRVMPFFPDLTVGGVLSVGGIGGNSHLYGCSAKNTSQLTVVTGLGEVTVCNLAEEPDLFEATLCGLGRCSIITSATLALRPCKPFVATYTLVYTDYKNWLADMMRLYATKSGDYLEAFCLPSFQGLHKNNDEWEPLPVWLYNIQVSFECDGKEDVDRYNSLLRTLKSSYRYYNKLVPIKDFTFRYGSRLKSIQNSTFGNSTRPWFECMIDLKTLSKVLPEILTRLPLSTNDGLGYRIFFMEKDNNPASFIIPDTSGPVVGFAALPMGIPPHEHERILDAIGELHRWLVSLGGKRYLSGWLGTNTQQFWQEHYGMYYNEWKSLKYKYDPDMILQSTLLQSDLDAEPKKQVA